MLIEYIIKKNKKLSSLFVIMEMEAGGKEERRNRRKIGRLIL